MSFKTLDTYGIFSIDGPDSTRFLNGQLTSDISVQKEGAVELTARVDRSGMLLFYGYILKGPEGYKVFCPNKFLDDFKEDLEKFIIMDDVSISNLNQKFSVSEDINDILDCDLRFEFLGRVFALKFQNSNEPIKPERLRELNFFYNLPEELGIELINQTVLVNEAVSNEKGCYVGQETVKKIENNRGAAKKDVLVEFNEEIEQIDTLKISDQEYKVNDRLEYGGKTFIKIKAKRDLRIEGKSIESLSKKGIIRLLPFNKQTIENLSDQYFEEGQSYFLKDEDLKAKELFETAYKLNPSNRELVESLGVLVGRLGEYQSAIEYMNKLEELDPGSVMACSNRSLYYMKLGNIEKAEEEKSEATVRTFKKSAHESQETKERKKKEMANRLSMFEQVLEIDPDDELANLGSAEIYFENDNIEKSQAYLAKLLDAKTKNPKALSLQVKILMKLEKRDSAMDLAKEVVDLASNKGDFVTANEMQSLVNGLTTP